MVAVTGSGLLALVALVVLVGWWLSVERHPYRQCPACKGGRKNAGSSSGRWGVCGRCGGRGNVRRFGARSGPPPSSKE
jgi:hypothetical protein